MWQIKALALNLMLVQCTQPCGPRALDASKSVCVHWICLISLAKLNAHLLTYECPVSFLSCLCPEGFTGTRCEIRNPCSTTPCINNGQCVNTPNAVYGTAYTCQCQPGFTGANCELQDFCAAQPCLDDAPCVNDGDTFYCDYCMGKLGCEFTT